MPAFKDLIGKKFNSLLVLERVENINGRVAWKCLCDCGMVKVIRTNDLKSGNVKTCGRCGTIFDSLTLEFKNDYAILTTITGKRFLIDIEDVPKIKEYNIYIDGKGYVHLGKNNKSMKLHRFLMSPKDKEVVDHINRRPYDNRKSNLRVCTSAENSRNLSISKNNTTGYTGVYYKRFRKGTKKWVAQIRYNSRAIHLGYFYTIEDAIKARKEAEQKYFGEFAPKN